MVVNPTRTKNFLYIKNPRRSEAGIFYGRDGLRRAYRGKMAVVGK
jgi:hypothetical protein